MTRMNSEIAGLLAAPVPDAAMVELVRADLQDGITGNAGGGRMPHLRAVEPTARGSIRAVIAASHPLLRQNKSMWRRCAWGAGFVFNCGLAAMFFNKATCVTLRV